MTQTLTISKYSEAEVPLRFGKFNISVYRDSLSKQESLAIHMGIAKNANNNGSIFTRIHSECLTGEVLSSLKCDCKDQLDMALATIAAKGQGLVIYLRQEGRGIGLGNKIKAYHLQNAGLNTIDANHKLGFDNDLRDFSIAALILKDMDITSIDLNTNNPDKIKALQSLGVNVASIVPSHAPVQEFNRAYLQAKKNMLGHLFSDEIFSECQHD
ncbi:MAG: GTP cyclohydrolase II [Bdellovibrionota bacterium]